MQPGDQPQRSHTLDQCGDLSGRLRLRRPHYATPSQPTTFYASDWEDCVCRAGRSGTPDGGRKLFQPHTLLALVANQPVLRTLAEIGAEVKRFAAIYP